MKLTISRDDGSENEMEFVNGDVVPPPIAPGATRPGEPAIPMPSTSNVPVPRGKRFS